LIGIKKIQSFPTPAEKEKERAGNTRT